ncbi:MAG: sugar-binding protein, partial [Opitutales bacterium]
ADHFVFRLKVRENDSLVFEVEAEETRQVIGEARDSKLRLAFVTNQIAGFWNVAKSGCLDAQRDLGVEVVVVMPPQPSVAIQKEMVKELLADGIDGIAISPLDADNQTAWLNEIAAQVPLITHDADAPESKRRVYLGMDNYKAGRMCGELVKKALPNGGGVMLFIGNLRLNIAKQRRQGVIDELFGRPVPESHDKIAHDPVEGVLDSGKYKILGTAVTGFAQARQMADDAIADYPDMKAMVGLFEYNLPACYQALKQAGKLGKIKLVGFDENDVTLQGIKDGTVAGTIVQNPYEYGYQSVKILKDILEGKQVQDFIDILPRKITKENVDAYWTDLKARKTGN